LPSTDVKTSRHWLRMAADLHWAEPDLTWQEIAHRVGRTPETMSRARRTEEWDVVLREAGATYLEKLAPAAANALLRQWTKGNANGAIEILRSLGFLRMREKRSMTMKEALEWEP
jgi:hypothetical protein